MTSVRVEPIEKDHLTYPTLIRSQTGNVMAIRECTGAQRRALLERYMTIEERVARIETILRQQGLLKRESL